MAKIPFRLEHSYIFLTRDLSGVILNTLYGSKFVRKVTMTTAIDGYNKLAKRYNGLEAHVFAKDLAEVHFKFIQDDVKGKILCAVVTPKDNGLAYLYFGIDPQIYIRDKYQVMRDHGIEEGEVYLPLEFKTLLN